MYEDSTVHGQCAWAAWTASVDGGAWCMSGGDPWLECSTYVSMYGHVYMYIYIYIHRCIFTVTPQIPTTIPPSRDIYTPHHVLTYVCIYGHNAWCLWGAWGA